MFLEQGIDLVNTDETDVVDPVATATLLIGQQHLIRAGVIPFIRIISNSYPY